MDYKRETEIIGSLKKLIAIPSVNSKPLPGRPFGQKVGNALEYMLEIGEKAGFRTVNLDGYAGYLEIGTGKKMVAALCHLDVVPPGAGWTYDPFKAEFRDGKIYGRGALDDKGPAIAAFYAMKSIIENGYNTGVRIRLILGLNEEQGSKCMDWYIKNDEMPMLGFTPDGNFPVINGEKGILQLKLNLKPLVKNKINKESSFQLNYIEGGDAVNMVPGSCKGKFEFGKEYKERILNYIENLKRDGINLKYSITSDCAGSGCDSRQSCNTLANSCSVYMEVYGKSGHASAPQEGDNAILKMCNILNSIAIIANTDEPVLDFVNKRIGLNTDGSLFGCSMKDEPSGALTMNTGTINVNNEIAEICIDLRYPVTVKEQEVLNRIIKSSEADGVKVRVISGMDPLYFPEDHPYVTLLSSIYKEESGDYESRPIITGGGTYARKMKGVIAFGPVLPGHPEVYHKADEYIFLENLLLCCKIYENALLKSAIMAESLL